MAKTKDLLQDHTGAAAIEFALVAPLLILFLTGITIFSIQIVSQTLLEYGIDAASRKIEIGDIKTGEGNPTALTKATICSLMTVLDSRCVQNLTVYAAAGSSWNSIPVASVNENGDFSKTGFDIGGSADFVLLQAAYKSDLYVPFLQNIIGQALNNQQTAVAFENEPF